MVVAFTFLELVAHRPFGWISSLQVDELRQRYQIISTNGILEE